MVAVIEGVLQPAQHHHTSPTPEHRARRFGIERATVPIGRENFILLEQVAGRVGQFERHAAGERHIGFTAQQRLRREMHGHQRGGARGLHVETRPTQVELVRHARGEEVLVVPGMPNEKESDVLHEGAVVEQRALKPRAHAYTGIHADASRCLIGSDAGMLECFVRALEEKPVLRIHDGRVLGRESPELRIPPADVVEYRRSLHVVRMRTHLIRDTGHRQLGVGKGPDAFASFPQQFPVFGEGAGPREAARGADNGDLGADPLLVGKVLGCDVVRRMWR
jgi:hypothetical protein